MKWFKHYSDVSINSNSMTALRAKHGWEGVGRYWAFVELLASQFDGDEPRFEIDVDLIKARLGFYHAKSFLIFVQSLSNLFGISIEIEGRLALIFYPKLLEIRDNHTKIRKVSGNKLRSNFPLEAKKLRSKDKEAKEVKELKPSENILELGDDELISFVDQINPSVQKRWLNLYPGEYIKRELEKMMLWIEQNPAKRPRTPRGRSSFITRWLDRGFENYRKSIPSQGRGFKTISEKRFENHKDMAQRVIDGDL